MWCTFFLDKFFFFWLKKKKRAWLVYFYYHNGVASLVQGQNYQVVESKLQEEMEWFILNKKNYGSLAFLTQFLVVIVIVLTLWIWRFFHLLNVFMIWNRGWIVISPTTFGIGLVIVYACATLTLMTICKKLTAIDDIFLIGQNAIGSNEKTHVVSFVDLHVGELVLEFRVMAGFSMICGLLLIFRSPMGHDYFAFFLIEVSAVAITTMAWVATWWVLHKFSSNDLSLPKTNATNKLRHANREGNENEKEESDERGLLKSLPSLQTALQDEQTVNFFLRYLARELSLENFFFLADVIHYKNAFVQHLKAFNAVPGFYISIPDLGKYQFVPDRTFVEYAWALSHVYVDTVNAPFVSALTFETREKILDYLVELEPQKETQFDSRQWKELCNVFDVAATEAWEQLAQSWKRYTHLLVNFYCHFYLFIFLLF
ncbi:hypothetical protein RFI_15820 [Reticulomyxa filosa]|uniref:RGS domain-containing protein n=1 Tax=Reticulomyxa filosa TaxID=46433 RepID=X6N6N2_RETFI|nr:hypothetical protein RFI_15820 [Reticulomyxa filosa]|eukprot:ETO21384.1 hypothetical protein RFI_15820 [Reticulomyxa filosa]